MSVPEFAATATMVVVLALAASWAMRRMHCAKAAAQWSGLYRDAAISVFDDPAVPEPVKQFILALADLIADKSFAEYLAAYDPSCAVEDESDPVVVGMRYLAREQRQKVNAAIAAFVATLAYSTRVRALEYRFRRRAIERPTVDPVAQLEIAAQHFRPRLAAA